MTFLFPAVLILQSFLPAQALKPMTNEDVLALVHSRKPESFIISQIQSRRGNFDTSAHEIIRLTKAGVKENELKVHPAGEQARARPLRFQFPSRTCPSFTW
jgi:hypothetical protein